MQTAGQTIAYALRASRQQLDMFTADLKGSDWLHRPSPKANCAAWIVGHLILADRRPMGLLGASDLPTLPEGFEKRFARDETAPGAADFGDTSILVPLFDRQRERFIDAVTRADESLLNKPVEKPTPRYGTVGELAAYMALHASMHAGQITLIRRSLGRPPIV
jgi:hypothetical protein